MTLTLIVAAAKDGAIGKGGALPFRLPDDLKRFKQLTSGHTVIMGRKTYESIGKPLPNRKNVVLTHDAKLARHNYAKAIEDAQGSLVVEEDFNEVMSAIEGQAFLVGGAVIYRNYADRCDRIEATLVNTTVPDADAHFDVVAIASTLGFREVARVHHPIDEKHEVSFDFVTYEKA